MLHVGMDLSRKRLDICVMDEAGNTLEEDAYPPDRDGLAHLARHVERTYGKQQVLGVIESMNGEARRQRRARSDNGARHREPW